MVGLTFGRIDFNSGSVEILLILPIKISSQRPQSEADDEDDRQNVRGSMEAHLSSTSEDFGGSSNSEADKEGESDGGDVEDPLGHHEADGEEQV